MTETEFRSTDFRLASIAQSVLFSLILTTAFPAFCESANAGDPRAAVKIARQYLETDSDDRRARLAAKLATHDDDFQEVVRLLQETDYEPVEPGYLSDEGFTAPNLSTDRTDDLLFFLIPKSYRPERATGLVIFMHGGGAHTGRRAPRYTIDFPDDDDDETSAMGDLFDEAGLIAVGPSAPWDEESYYRWCLEEADDYLADVIVECKHRFHIDPDRVFLLGHSMGGFGAFHHVQRQPDRFAAVIANAGSWKLGYWPVIRGTRFCFINGLVDAQKGERWHYTDIEYARWSTKLLTAQGLDHTFIQHDHGHNLCHGKRHVADLLRTMQDVRRDPYFEHIVLASPVGYSRYYSSKVRHNRWLTLDEATEGRIEYDELLSDEEVDFDDWKLEHRTSRRPGAAIEAKNLGDNTIECTTQNVARFTVWLHPKMVDVRQPVRIVVDGKVRFEGRVKPSLAAALDSYERRRDWGMVYPMRVTVYLPGDSE